jgi:Xaa-Pro dipeptidase
MHEHRRPLTTLADQIGVLQMTTSFASPGSMNVDWEERWNVDRLRTYRLARAREALARSDVGAVLLFDFNNIRYVTSTHIGEWARDKMTRYALLTRGGDPHIWDFGSAAKHHRLNCPWLRPENVHAGMIGLRGAVAPDAGLFRDAAKQIRAILDAEGVGDMPIGVDLGEPPMLAALADVGITVRDGQQVMLDAREVKSKDEIILLNTACAMVDGAYQMIAEQLKPGVRESELVANVTKALFDMGSEHVDNINAVSGERCSPHPHVFSDRLIRPGDQAFFDIIHTFVGYKTCYYRTFVVGKGTDAQRDAYKQAREWIDASIELMRPGVTTDQVAKVWPKAEEFGFDNEMECFGLQFGHSVGLFLHERPIISRLNSLDHPVEIKEGMVIALETYCPAKDGVSAARIEEEVVVTADGPVVITRFPSDELFVANAY